MKNKPEKIIIVRERRHGCGIFSLLIVIALIYGGYRLTLEWKSDLDRETERKIHELEHGSGVTIDELIARECAAPTADEIMAVFRNTLKDRLHDPASYKPVDTRGPHPHPLGRAYVQSYRAKNRLGATVLERAGLLCATNLGRRVWTYYDESQLSDLLLNQRADAQE